MQHQLGGRDIDRAFDVGSRVFGRLADIDEHTLTLGFAQGLLMELCLLYTSDAADE